MLSGRRWQRARAQVGDSRVGSWGWGGGLCTTRAAWSQAREHVGRTEQCGTREPGAGGTGCGEQGKGGQFSSHWRI